MFTHTHACNDFISYLYSDQHRILVGAQVVTFSKEDLAKGSLSKLPLQNNFPPFDMLNIWETETEEQISYPSTVI